MTTWCVYIIAKEGKYYTGITNHFQHRMEQHGVERALYVENANSAKDAARREREIKGWNRVRKEALWKGRP